MTIEQVPEQGFSGETFEEFAASMPEDAKGFLEPDNPPLHGSGSDGGFLDSASLREPIGAIPSPDQLEEKRVKRIKMSRKMKKSMDNLKAKVAQLPVIWFHSQSKANPEWKLDKEEEELLTDSITTVFEVLDIEMQIEPLTWTLTSIYWVLAYPLLTFAFLWVTKSEAVAERQRNESNQDAQ
jgi:hypothetical protein